MRFVSITDVRIELWDRDQPLRHRYHLRKLVVVGRRKTDQLRRHLRGQLLRHPHRLSAAADEVGVTFQVPRKIIFLRKFAKENYERQFLLCKKIKVDPIENYSVIFSL